jgi:hypothetical protein
LNFAFPDAVVKGLKSVLHPLMIKTINRNRLGIINLPAFIILLYIGVILMGEN